MARAAVAQQCANCSRTTAHRLTRGLCTTCLGGTTRYGTVETANNPLAILTTRPNLTDADHTWIDQAACRPHPTRLFFPELGEDARPAKQICQGCPVAARCLQYAHTNRIKFGIWGGLSEKERRRQRGRLARGETA